MLGEEFVLKKLTEFLTRDFTLKEILNGIISFCQKLKYGLFFVIIFFFSWIYSTMYNFIDWDFWARITVGKIFFQLGKVLNKDIFSFTPTKSMWIDHEWGSGVVFYFLVDNFGGIGIMLFKILCYFLIVFLISKVIKLQNIKPNQHLNIVWYIFIIWGMFYGMANTVRCQMFTFVFFALWIYILERIKRGENRLLWTLPATMLIWANLHGGFVSGLGLLVIYGIGEFLNRKPFKKYFLILIPSALITIINPYGIDYWSFMFHATTMNRATITEWKPTDLFGPFSMFKGFKLYFILVALGVTSLVTKTISSFVSSLKKNKAETKDFKSLIKDSILSTNFDATKYIIVAVTMYLALKHIKMQALFVIASGCFLYHDFYGIFTFVRNVIVSKFGDIWDKVFSGLAMTKTVLVYTLLVASGMFLVPKTTLNVEAWPSKYPVGSVEFVKQNKIEGNLVTVFHFGSYAIWKLFPQNLLAEDGRYEEVYPEEVHNLVFNFNYRATPDWEAIYKKYPVDVIILEKANYSYPEMQKNPYWKEVYSDIITGVFVPAKKAKNSYIYPVLDRSLYEDKLFETSINFLD